MTDPNPGAQTPVSDADRPSQHPNPPGAGQNAPQPTSPAPTEPDTHGRPSDDSDPGHS
ncbi:hypothetical protein [Deinococcus multiflagellatus]|uniref:Uncharacterized protein n=1 Tax=Deinococcus multiflagellatus TaxID=1656887 RepID=A0ABW1ZK04_9DEIO|nr:hypothetical protein [Deinococcus multiflagellatus]MBZ9712445.1 hypothetical protein [Deinococcus multiflagellatus]